MKKYIGYVLCCFLFVFPSIVFAKVTCSNGDFSATIEIDKENLSINENANITITSDFDYKVEYKSDNKLIHISKEGIITPISKGNAKITAVIEFLENDSEIGECTSILDINILSNDASLKLLNLEELDISSVFNKDTYTYEVKLPYNYEKINIIAEASDSNATITGDGRRYLNEGNNEYEIIVKATDGTTQTYKIIVLRESANDDNSLKNLIVEGYELSPQFNSEVYEYTLNVDKNVDDINISAKATYDLAKIIGVGNYKLATGENKFFITVIAENNTEQKYTITVNKNKGDSRLSGIEIDGFKLDKKFDSENFTYNITVPNDIDKLDIKTTVQDNEQVEIIGNESLNVGENNIIIRVSKEDSGATTYKIIVNKMSVEEQKEQEENDMLLKILLIIFVISILIMITVIVIFYKRNYKGKKKKIKKINQKNKKK